MLRLLATTLVLLVWPFHTNANNTDDFKQMRQQVASLGKLTTAPRFEIASGYDPTEDLKPIFFDALDYEGNPTKVFAWLGMPENVQGKVPGVVLVHGGGGTAFKEWVQKWNEKGFAAISIAVEGQTDVRAKRFWKQHQWPGPVRVGIYGDSDKSLKQQWMYHAVADTLLANSLLRSLPQVNSEQVGVAGISWGGVITSTVMGIDNRFAFAIPTYGCGNLSKSENQYGRALGNNEIYKQVWDPILRMKNATMPALWLSWPGDKHFALDKQAACYEAMTGEVTVALIPGMKHGHGAGWNPPDSYAFARSVVDAADGKPWCQSDGTTLDGNSVATSFTSSKPIEKAFLISTTNSGATGERKWTQTPAELFKQSDTWHAQATLPPNTTNWFINGRSDGLTVSSKYQGAGSPVKAVSSLPTGSDANSPSKSKPGSNASSD